MVGMVEVKPHEKFEGVYWIIDTEKILATKNLAPGVQVYGERLFRVGGVEYRAWIPYRSKLAAAILKGIKEIFIRPGSKVLYLGTATGTTSSHVSDIIGESGILYGVEFASRVMIQFKRNVADRRPNVIPIFADARKPSTYAGIVDSLATIVQGNRCVLYVWYDNEYGYSYQVVRIVEKVSGINLAHWPK